VFPKSKGGFACFKLADKESCMGEMKGRQHPALDSETRRYLVTVFRPMLDQFKRITGMQIQLW